MSQDGSPKFSAPSYQPPGVPLPQIRRKSWNLEFPKNSSRTRDMGFSTESDNPNRLCSTPDQLLPLMHFSRWNAAAVRASCWQDGRSPNQTESPAYSADQAEGTLRKTSQRPRQSEPRDWTTARYVPQTPLTAFLRLHPCECNTHAPTCESAGSPRQSQESPFPCRPRPVGWF
ncbi:MAG: hypothetical protein RL215_739 [Planctomycetota bacterium]